MEDVPKVLNVGLERAPSRAGERYARTRLLGNEALLDFDITGLFQGLRSSVNSSFAPPRSALSVAMIFKRVG